MTSSPHAPTHPAPGDHRHSLGRHVRQCQAAQQRWVRTARLAERAHGLLAPRFMTTVAVGVLILLAVCTGWS